ncbi:MAG: nucleotidyltransferase family protein [Pseudomonadota bacterium]
MPKSAMILAAGLGMRMRPITETIPKPLVQVGGKPMIEYALEGLERLGVETIIVNVHHLPQQIIDYLSSRPGPKTKVSDETDLLLDSGGALVKALPLLGDDAFFILNADTFWLEPEAASSSNLAVLSDTWDPEKMDILLLTAQPDQAVGYGPGGDFHCDECGRLSRYDGVSDQPVIYAGAAIVHPRILAGAPVGPFSLNLCFDDAISKGSLFGVAMQGLWLTVGTPEAIGKAEHAMRAFESDKEPAP